MGCMILTALLFMVATFFVHPTIFLGLSIIVICLFLLHE